MDNSGEASRFRMSAAADRRASYKTPGGRDGRMSQEARRAQALEEQKRRRLQRVDESRHLDMFADLNLGDSDDEDEDEDDSANAPQVVREGISQFASMLQSGSDTSPAGSNLPQVATSTAASPTDTKQKSKSKPKRRKKRKSKWADKCMYAELLEMNEDVLLEPLFPVVDDRILSTSPSVTGATDPISSAHDGVSGGGFSSSTAHAHELAPGHDRQYTPNSSSPGPMKDGSVPVTRIGGVRLDDGIPEDLESAWAALAPVPAGKRCLAVTMKGAGWRGVGGAPNTCLRARLTGLPLRPPLGPQQPFPTALPPNTILDCILDKNWKLNGILHVLDVVRWKGVDLGGCGAGLRFWWRDTRLGELIQLAPPSQSAPPIQTASPPSPVLQPPTHYIFSYPTTIVPVPFVTPTTYETLLHDVIPRVRRPSGVRVCIPAMVRVSIPSPVVEENPSLASPVGATDAPEADMQVDTPTVLFRPQVLPAPLQEVEATFTPDGILLYLTEAAYTSGTGPLSAWVPLKAYGDPGGGKGEGDDDLAMQISPVDLFESSQYR